MAGAPRRAVDYAEWQRTHPGEPFPIAVALGADPATILGP